MKLLPKKETEHDERGKSKCLLCFSLTIINQPGYITSGTRGLHIHDVIIAAMVQGGMQVGIH